MNNQKICQTGTNMFSKTISGNRKCLGIVTINKNHHGYMDGDAARGTPFPKGGGLWR